VGRGLGVCGEFGIQLPGVKFHKNPWTALPTAVSIVGDGIARANVSISRVRFDPYR